MPFRRDLSEAAGFPEIQVAFTESVYRRQGTGPLKFKNFLNDSPLEWNFNPMDCEGLPALRKPFTPTLGLAIAPLQSPYYEGSGGIFLRLSSDEADTRIGLLTCAHVARPPPLFPNEAYTRPLTGYHVPEYTLLLGTGAYNKAVCDLMEFIRVKVMSIRDSELELSSRVPAPQENESADITAVRKRLVRSIEQAKVEIEKADELHSFVTKNFTTAESRIFGFVLHSAKIETSEDGFMLDWSVIQLDDKKIDLSGFHGNKLFVGENKSFGDWCRCMYPRNVGGPRLTTPDLDMLLPLKGYVPEAELRNPQDLDKHGNKALLAVKNGRTTGTTFGRVNGLESITRQSPGSETALEFVVCNYDDSTTDTSKFSEDGDSGSFVVDRDGRLIGQLTGGGGPTYRADRSVCITPWYALKKAVDAKFPGCHLL